VDGEASRQWSDVTRWSNLQQPLQQQQQQRQAATAYKIIDFVHILDTNKHSLGSARVERSISLPCCMEILN